MKDSKHLVIGIGEVGKPIYNILKEHYEVHSFDQMGGGTYDPEIKFDVIHICFGHKENEQEDFIGWVRDYKERFLKHGGLIIVHSTVAVGTTIKIGIDAVHSPIRGMHYNMETSIRTFVKFFGGWRASEAAEYFRRIGIKTVIVDKTLTTEAMKLFDTEYYRVCIEFAKEVKSYCDNLDINFHEVYTIPNITYNEGYKELGHQEYLRPVLQPIKGELGGHCLIPNSKLIRLEMIDLKS